MNRGSGILSEPLDPGRDRRSATSHPHRRVRYGTALLHRSTGTRGTLVKVVGSVVVLRDRLGRERSVSNLPGGFALDGETITLIGLATTDSLSGSRRTASGSIAAPTAGAKVAVGSRIWVEGDHDARLLERIWGDDLRDLAIVVEPLGGIDELAHAVRAFSPSSNRRLGVLVDHLVAGSKESRIAASVNDPNVLVVGHPFVDIWQCVRPGAVSIDRWPAVPFGEDWKTGVCERLGWGTPQDGWRRVLSAVNTFADLEPGVLGAVEQLLDFLTVPVEES